MTPWIISLALIAGGLATAIWIASTYNHLVALANFCDNSFAQIEVQLKRRYDLIPNLVESVRGYLAHERDVLDRVLSARHDAASRLNQAARERGNAEKLENWMGAEGTLACALGRLSLAIEAYPELQGNQSVAALTEELTSTENRISFARQSYNDWVTGFNSYRQSFPSCLFAGLFGYGANRQFLTFAEKEKLHTTPSVALVL
ncbi:MAG: LemA family protein [Pirellulaceae bacterium]